MGYSGQVYFWYNLDLTVGNPPSDHDMKRMNLYAYSTPDMPKHRGYLKIGEASGSIEKRIKQQGRELDVRKVIEWDDHVITERQKGIDKEFHRYLVRKKFDIKKFEESGLDTEWVKCTKDDLKNVFPDFVKQLAAGEKKRQALGDKFFLEIRNWYYWVVGTNSKIDPEYALRLIVRLLFCFFLKDKELIPNELFDELFVQMHLKENEEYRYYNAILRNLFFRCLNAPLNERSDIEHKKLMKHAPSVKEQFNKVPFLNGGIFNEHNGDDVPLRNDYFFAELQTQTLQGLDGEDHKVAGIIRILSQYHFKLTLDESIVPEHYDKTVDPEFIGKVFESLLACIDAESKESRRKVTGSYYTPREIVASMVNDSLDAYLDGTLPRPESFTEENWTTMQLLQCKILDPACGSGAFPCEIMNEIMQRIDPHGELSQSERYRKKLEIIQKVIYGVDIQPIAVQISLFRLFLSLIQEIVPNKRKDNYGIEPLPNLETKLVCADALIGLKKDRQGYLESQFIRNQFKELRETRNKYFKESDSREKDRLRKHDESLRKLLVTAMSAEGVLSDETTEQLATWNPYDQSKTSPFFDSSWMFGVAQYNIVIGNPPYIQLRKGKGTGAKRYKNCGYDTFTRTADIYMLFYERGWQLLEDGGYLCFLTSNKWMRTGYGKPLRKFLCEKTNPIILIDLASMKVFRSAMVDVNILLFAKEENKHQTLTHVVRGIADLKVVSNREMMAFSSSPWVILSSIEQSIKRKIEANGVPLKDWNIRINYGIKTGRIGAFIINGAKKDELITTDPKSAELLKSILRGKDIRRYGYKFANLWLINTHNGIKGKGISPVNIKDYPSIKKHLDSFYPQLEKRADQGNTPYNLRNCAYLGDFSKPKLLWAETMRIRKDRSERFPRFAYTEEHFFTDSTCYIATGEDLIYVMAILNSAMGRYQLNQTVSMLDTGGFLMKKMYVEQIFICNASPLKKETIIAMVKSISGEDDEVALDNLIFDLYGLSETERRHVLKSFTKPLLRNDGANRKICS